MSLENKLKDERNDIYGITTKCDQCREFIKEINESQIYQVLCSYQFKSKIGNKLSTNFDEQEGVFLDNIRAQHHLKAMKDYQDFMENSQKYLIREFNATLFNFMNNIQEKLNETNQRITNESKFSNRRLIATEHKLLSLINKNKEEIKSKSDESSNKINRLKRELRRNKKEHQAIFEEIAQDLNEFRDEFDDARSKQVKINQDVDQDFLKIKEYQAELKEKIYSLSEEYDKKLSTIKSRIKKLSKETKNLREQQIEVKENLSTISKLLIFK